MDFQIKLLELTDAGSCLIVIARGIIHPEGLEGIFRKIAEASRPLFDCKVLVDLEEATLRLEHPDRAVDRLRGDLARRNLKIALVSSLVEMDRLRLLGDSLCDLGLQAGVFADTKGAVSWLSERP